MTFRRTGWRLVAWYLFAGVLWLLSAAVVVGFSVAWFPLNSWTAEKVLFIVLTGVLAVAAVRSTLAMHSWIRHFEIYFLTIDEDGVRLRLPGVGETHVAWHEIQGITHQKRWIEARDRVWLWLYRMDAYTILTCRGPFAFTSMEVLRPNVAARFIAERVGVGVQELADARERQSPRMLG